MGFYDQSVTAANGEEISMKDYEGKVAVTRSKTFEAAAGDFDKFDRKRVPNVIYAGMLGSLKRFQDDAKEVSQGYKCGITIERFNDIKEGDIIEGFVSEEVKD